MARRRRPGSASGRLARDPRARRMAQLYAEGATLEEVGSAFSLSRERARQIMVAAGYDVSALKLKAKRARRRRMAREYGSHIHAMLEQGHPVQAVASRLSVPVDFVRTFDKSNPDYARHRKAYRKRSNPAVKYTDEEVLGCLRAASRQIGGVLTTSAYTQLARRRAFGDGRPWPTHQTAFLRFGAWRRALEAAGLHSNPSSPIAGRQLFDRAHCIDAILEVERAVGHLPSVTEYSTYATRMDGVLPSISTIRHRFGGWQLALRAAAEFGMA